MSDGRTVRLLPLDPRNLYPEIVKTILYITRDHKYEIGQAAVEAYYRHNVNRLRRYAKKRVGEIEYLGADMYYVTDVYAYVDELQPGRLIQYIKTALRNEKFTGTLIFDRLYSVVDLVCLYLKELKARSEFYLGEKALNVTLGRPVRFSDSTDQDNKAEATLREAALESGFGTVNFELEPVAASLYYELSLNHKENVLIFDFGGGTLDISIVQLGDEKHRLVYANAGIDIAGSNFDRAIIERRLLKHFGKGTVDQPPEIDQLIDAVSDWISLPELSLPRTRLLLRKFISNGINPIGLKALEALIYNDLAFSFYHAVEKSKIDLSSEGASVICLHDKDIDLWELYTRVQFEKDIQDYLIKVEQLIRDTVNNSGLEIPQIDAVVKTGGSSNIPIFTSMLERIFGKEKVKTLDVFSSVSAGLAISAARKNMGIK